MRITEIDSCSDLFALKDRWNDVLRRCDHSVFSTWEWLSTCAKHFGNDKRLRILLAEENNKIIGIAPLMYSIYSARATMFGLRQGKIEFIGPPYSDYNDFIIADRREECLRLFMDYLNDLPEKWDNIELTDVPQNSKCVTVLSKISKNLRPVHRCSYIPLPKSYDTFLSNLSRNFRKDLRSNSSRLEKDFKVDFVDCSEIQSCNEGMNQFFGLHQKRWESRGYHGAFCSQEFRSFHLDIARSFSEKGWLSLFLLKLSGEPAAASYGFKYSSKLYAYLSGFATRYSRYGIGNLLKAYTIRECIQEGLTEFDFMRGAEEYKDRWNTMTKWNLEATIPRRGFPAGFRSLLYRSARVYWSQGTRLARLLRAPTKHSLA
jgi:CelD/BcsL family acetyltransferase involved in cellulose biosynthesis